MIVNLIGPIAVGKTTFVRWFINRNKDWRHWAIDEIRNEAVKYKYKNPEVWVSDYIKYNAEEAKNCIIETTGNWWRLEKVYIPELIKRGIYTIKFCADTKECKKRAKQRNRVMPAPYNADELQAIEYYKHNIPANLIVDLTAVQKLDNIYEQIEYYILKALIFYNAKEVNPLVRT